MLKRAFFLVLVQLVVTVFSYAQVDPPVAYICFDRDQSPDGDLIILDATTQMESGRIPLINSNPFISLPISS